MAINAYTGLPGSGKSYGVIENVIVPALKKGRAVWTNIPVNEQAMAAFAGCLPQAFSVDDLRANPRWFQEVLPAGAVLVLDEAWRLWPAGLKTNHILETHKSFLAEHRHLVGNDGFSTEIYLVTQDLAQIAAFARQLVDSTYRAHKLSAVGMSKKFRLDIYDGPVTGAKPPKDKRIREIYGTYKAEIYALYKSHTMSETGAAGDETATDKRKNVFSGMGFKSVIFGLFAGSLIVVWGLYKFSAAYNKQPAVLPGNGQAAAPGAPAKAVKPVEENHFLKSKAISIAFNFRTGETIDFRFRVSDGDRTSTIDGLVLARLGYAIRAFDECLVEIAGHGIKLYAQCQGAPVPKAGLNLSSVASAAGADSTSPW